MQGIAHSTDGRTFTEYDGNPVLRQITGGNRVPTVMWHEPAKKWAIVLYVTLEGGNHAVHFFTSPNLREWTSGGITVGIAGTTFLHECPTFLNCPWMETPPKGNGCCWGPTANKQWATLMALTSSLNK